MTNTGHVPVSVNYAANLCGLVGAFGAFAVFHFTSVGKAPQAGFGLFLAVAFFAVMWGLRRGSRPARIGALVLGASLVLLGLLMLLPGGWLGLVLVALGALLLALLLLPQKARRHFDRHGAHVGAS